MTRTRSWTAIFIAAVLLGMYQLSQRNYLLCHFLVEIVSIVVSFSVFAVGWNTRWFAQNNMVLVLSVGYLTVAGLDTLHVLAYEGRGIFPGEGANLSAQLWIAARYVESTSFLMGAYLFRSPRKISAKLVVAIYSVVGVLLLVFLFWLRIFPECYIDEKGPTAFKIASEYVISALLLLAGYRMWHSRNEQGEYINRLLLYSIFFTVLSELGLTLGMDVYGVVYFIVHVLKAASTILVYVALVENSLKQPYASLFYNLERSRRELEEELARYRRTEEQVKYLSFHDKLTGLYNRAFFEEELHRLDAERQLPLSIIIADVNGLKLTNDGFGHQEGDRLLQRTARVLKMCCRQEDVVARWGGDEFAIVLPRTNEDAVEAVVARIKRACAQENDPSPIRLSIAVGAATKKALDEPIDDVVRAAEDRMYRQKLIEAPIVRDLLINSLSETLEQRNYEPKEHIEFVKKLSVRVGKRLGLPQNQLDDLAVLAQVHDIGKLSIPEHILTKLPQCLSQEEAEILRRHPEIGYRIANASSKLAHIADAILAEHEKWNGTGYPRGLAGEKIPLAARILSVVHTYDALINGSESGKSLRPEEAAEYIKKRAGRDFDPKVVDAFLQVIQSSEKQLQ